MISVIIPVYRNSKSALQLISTLETQTLPVGESLEVIAVDDGSGDDTAAALRRCDSPLLRVISLPTNCGRVGARNAGAARARGEYLIFIDCDCEPIGTQFLCRHTECLDTGCVACSGPVTGAGSEFWCRYQEHASHRRQSMHEHGDTFAGTTQNFSVRAGDFRALGGFCTDYHKYGFEDRDILIRLAQRGKIGWCADAPVRHHDQLTLPNVLVKMQLAGGPSAVQFSRDHPGAYKRLGYSALDVRAHGWLRAVSWAAKPILHAAPIIDRMLDKPWMPYAVAAALVKLLSALAYMRGTAAR